MIFKGKVIRIWKELVAYSGAAFSLSAGLFESFEDDFLGPFPNIWTFGANLSEMHNDSNGSALV